MAALPRSARTTATTGPVTNDQIALRLAAMRALQEDT